MDLAHRKPLSRLEESGSAPRRSLSLMKTAFGGFCVKGRKDGKADYFTRLGKVKADAPNHLLPQSF